MNNRAWLADIAADLVHLDWRLLLLIRVTVCVAACALLAQAAWRAPATTRHHTWAATIFGCMALAVVGMSGLFRQTGGRWNDTLNLVWAGGAAIVLLRMFLGAVVGARYRSRALRVGASGALNALEGAQRVVGVRRPVTLLEASDIVTPVVFGWFRPAILLPSSWGEWQPERLMAVLLHELYHVKRRDWVVQIAERFVCAVLWFHPLVWLAARRRQLEAERACDEAVLAAGVSAREYALHLLHFAESPRNPALVGAAGFVTPRMSELEQRVRGMVLHPKMASWRFYPLLAAGVIALSMLGSVAASSAPTVCPIAARAARGS